MKLAHWATCVYGHWGRNVNVRWPISCCLICPCFDYPCWCKLPICPWLSVFVSTVCHFAFTFDLPWARKTRHPSTQLTHRRALWDRETRRGLMRRLALTLKYMNMRVFQLKWDENRRTRAIKTDRERDGCCVLTITLINLPVLGDAIDWNAIPLRSLISTFLSLLLSACERVYMCLQKKAQLSFFLLEMWICGTAGMGS